MPGRVTGAAGGWPGLVVAAALAIPAVGCAGLLRPRRVSVSGCSMQPTLLPGDHLLALRAGHPRVGDLVVVRSPTGREVVKRLAAVRSSGVEVLGDNPAASTDSRTWGLLPHGAVRGRVVYRYAPPSRTGRP